MTATADIKNIYFLGIGGIGMSALARYFKMAGKNISGYDKTPSPLTDELQSEGMEIHFEDNPSLIPDPVRNNKQDTLVIYTPAVPSSSREFSYFSQQGYTLKKRSEILGDISRQHYTIAVAGTHGKTTISSMIAHILRHAGIECTAFLGGISKNYNTNLLLSSEAPEKVKLVVEADEYDRSFHTLFPDVAVISAMDPDHLDIYGTADEMQEAYRHFAKQIKYGGRLFAKEGLGFKEKCTTYSLDREAKYHARNIRIENNRYVFDLASSVENLQGMVLGMPGLHNVENAVVAVAVAQYLRIVSSKIREALESYAGIRRRFDLRVNTPGAVYIDDYAHHPEELRACIKSLRDLYPGKKITGIFQPHLYSRTRDFADGFAEVLSLLDKLILLDIYPAREEPIPGVSSKIILDRVSIKEKLLCTKAEALEEVKKNHAGVIVTLGAGDIDQMIEPITNILSGKK